jgi:hypothetical protein
MEREPVRKVVDEGVIITLITMDPRPIFAYDR